MAKLQPLLPRFPLLIVRRRRLEALRSDVRDDRRRQISAEEQALFGTPEDAFRCFTRNELDVLVVGNCVLQKSEQDPARKQDYRQAFEAD